MKKTLPIYVFAAAVGLASAPAMADKTMSKSDVEAVIKQYLNDHPDVIVDALKKFQVQAEKEANKKAAAELTRSRSEIINGKYSPIAGNPKGDVTVVEFFDYHCGYCKRMLPVVTDLMKDDGKVKMTFKEFPILAEDSELAAKASLAFSHLKPSKYFAYHTALMGMSGKFDEDKLIEEAKKLGADENDMKKEMKSDWIKTELRNNKELGEKLNVRGTPGFIIGDTMIPGAASLDDMKKAVSEARHASKDNGDKKADKEAKDDKSTEE